MRPQKSGTSPVAIIAIFVGILLAIVAVATAFILMSQPPPPQPPCVPGLPCAPGPSLPPIANASPTPRVLESPGHPPTRPPSSGAPASPGPSPAPSATPEPGSSVAPAVILGGSSWQSGLGVGFEFDGSLFNPQTLTDNLAVLNMNFFDAQVVVDITDEDLTPAEMIQRELTDVDTFMIGRTEDKDDYDQVLGPSIGFVPGEVKVFSGILTNSDGTPAAQGGVTILAATNGRVSVAIVVIVADPDARFGSDTQQYVVRTAVDDIVKTFSWGDGQ